jgi:hypothetical protein
MRRPSNSDPCFKRALQKSAQIHPSL